MSFKLYSIESRKGGVGKTTIALNLAKTLLNRGPVLLLDCDITGTSISEPANNSIYWQTNSNVLMEPIKKVDEEDGQPGSDNLEEKRKPLNLLGYFLNYYIRGNADVDTFLNSRSLFTTKINIIGSEIYGKTSKAIVDTRLLMDEIHSYWFMEFVDMIIQKFDNNFEGKDVSVILDNSPGFVGFCEALHQYMFHLGPEQAKFIFVSSMDAQDIQASISAAEEVRQGVENRRLLANYFEKINNDGNEEESLEKKLNENSDLKNFFFELVDDKELKGKYQKQQILPPSFITLVLNKVSPNFRDDNFGYKYEDVVGKSLLSLFYNITSSKDEKPRTLVYYDEAISYQYYYRYMKNKADDNRSDGYDWTRRFKDLEKQSYELSLESDRVNAIYKLDKLYQNLLKNLSDRGYTRIGKNLPMVWQPVYAIEKLNATVTEFLQMAVFDKDIITPSLDAILHQWNLDNLKIMNQLIGDTLEYRNLSELFTYIEKLVDINKKNGFDAPKLVLSSFLYVFVQIFNKQADNKDDLRGFCLKEYAALSAGRDWSDYLGKTIQVNAETRLSVESLSLYFNRFFNGFYTAFCYAFVRMSDVYSDFNAILTAVKLYVPNSAPIGMPSDMILYLTKVIVNKSEEFDENKLGAIKMNFFAMNAVQSVIRSYVLKS